MSAIHDFISHPFFSVFSALLGFLFGQRFNLWRDRRKELNEAADVVFEGLHRELEHHWSPNGHVASVEFANLRRRLEWWRRGSFDHALAAYEKAKKDCIGRDSVGGVVRKEPNGVRATTLALMKFAERR